MVRLEGFEPPTCCSGGNRSIHLSYRRTLVEVYLCGPRWSRRWRSRMHPGRRVRRHGLTGVVLHLHGGRWDPRQRAASAGSPLASGGSNWPFSR